MSEEDEEKRSSGPGSHRAIIVIDDRSGPQWETPDEPQIRPAIEIILDWHDAADPLTTEPIPTAEANERAPADRDEPPVVVDTTSFLPIDEPEEPSTLANLFGFGERQATYREWTETDTVVDDEAWDSLPSLADVAIEGEGYRPTETAIQRLWDATEDHEIAIDPIEPLTVEPPEKLTDSKRFRRPAIIAVAAVVALGAWIVREVAEQPARAADAREVRYDQAASEIRSAIAPLEESIGSLPQTDLELSDFAQLTQELDVLDGIARSSAALSSEALPSNPIVGSSLPIDDLILPKRLLEQASVQALNLEQRIGDALAYRLTFANAFNFPNLPDQASLQEIGTIGGTLSVAIAETELMLGQLPGDPFFAKHRQTAVDLIATLEAAQADYFTALREGDVARAGQIRDAMMRSIDDIRAGLDQPLAATEAWADAQIDELGGVLDEIQSLVG